MESKDLSLSSAGTGVIGTIVQMPVIAFDEYEGLLQDAYRVAELVRGMEVTGDNVKEIKKVLAAVNKSVKRLNDRRIEIKKEIMKPYETFNAQIKEIERVVKEADEMVRQNVRLLEEREREDKKNKLVKIWLLRIQTYDYAGMVPFDRWLEPSHLNKSTSVSKAEDQMVDFLETVEKDLTVLRSYGQDHMALYLDTLNLADTLAEMERRQKERDRVGQSMTTEEPGLEYVITIRDEEATKEVIKCLTSKKIAHTVQANQV